MGRKWEGWMGEVGGVDEWEGWIWGRWHITAGFRPRSTGLRVLVASSGLQKRYLTFPRMILNMPNY